MKPILLATAALVLAMQAAAARPARCETTDDGAYACDFQPLGRNGSFRISARGKPTFTVEVDEPGVAQAYANFGGRNVALPGPYRLSRTQPGCWVSDATGARICAR